MFGTKWDNKVGTSWWGLKGNKPKMAYSRDLSKMAMMDYQGLSKTIKDYQGLSRMIKDD